MELSAPFPYFGGKSLIADRVWELFGDVKNYIEPFCGSLAVLLARPSPFTGSETVNDKSCLLINTWRAMQYAPEELAHICVAPVSEVNTEAQHYHLVDQEQTLRDKLGDPFYYDVNMASFYIKGLNEWIGTGFATGEGIWVWNRAKGWTNQKTSRSVHRKLPHLGNHGKGINKKIDESISPDAGEFSRRVEWLQNWFCALKDRLCQVRITCGDWERVVKSDSSTTAIGTTAVFLDPPYESTEWIYSSHHKIPNNMEQPKNISEACNRFCQSRNDSAMKIIVCGKDDEHDNLLDLGWKKETWKTRKGYSNETKAKEFLWYSPTCQSRS